VSEQVLTAAIGAVAGAAGLGIVNEFFVRPRPTVRLLDISILPGFRSDSPEKNLDGVAKWLSTIGSDALVPIPSDLASITQNSMRFPSLDTIDRAQLVGEVVRTGYLLRQRLPLSMEKAKNLLSRLERDSFSRKEQQEVIETITTDALIQGEVVGSLRREEIRLKNTVDEDWKNHHPAIISMSEFSETKDEGQFSGYILRFPTFSTRASYRGDTSELPLIKPYFETLQYFHTEGIKEGLNQTLSLLKDAENEAIRLVQKFGDLLNPLNIVVANTKLENRGGSKLTLRPDCILRIGVPHQKASSLHLTPLGKKEVVVDARSYQDLNFVSKPLTDEGPQGNDVSQMLTVVDMLSAGICFETLGHGPLGARKYLCSKVQQLGERIQEREINALEDAARKKTGF